MLFQCKACGPATDHGSAPRRSGKAKPWRTIDIHCHCMVPEANAMVLKATGIPGGGETPNANAHVNALTRSIQPQRGKIDFPKLTDLDTRLADMDRDGIDVQVLYGSLGLSISTIQDVDFAIAMSRACNDYYASFCSASPDRLKCTATLAVQDISAAVEEVERAITELGHAGVMLPPNHRGIDLASGYFDPIFAKAQQLDVPVSIHWGNGAHLHSAGGERFDTHFMLHAVGHPVEQMIAMANIICGGVVEDFPDLRVGFLEAGCGWAAYWVERLDEHFERRSREMPKMTKEATDYFADGNLFLSAEPDEKLIPVVAAQLGNQSVMYSSDYPHTDSKFPYSVKTVKERDDLSDDLMSSLLAGNAARYYKLDA